MSMGKILASLWFIPSLLFSQIDTAKLQFYPLQIGNLWQYRGEGSGVIWTIKIIGDTVINDRMYYKRANPNYPQNAGFVRVDSAYHVVQRQADQEEEYNPIYRLNEPLGSAYQIPSDVAGASVICKGTKDIMKYASYVESAIGPGMDAMIFYPGKIDTVQMDTCVASEFRFILVKGLGVYREEYEADRFMQLTGAIINGVKWGTIVSVEEDPLPLPEEFTLLQNYPNPFNGRTTIMYTISKETEISLKIYNILGQVVRTLVEGVAISGLYTINFDASDLPSGVYFYRLTGARSTVSKKLLISK